MADFKAEDLAGAPFASLTLAATKARGLPSPRPRGKPQNHKGPQHHYIHHHASAPLKSGDATASPSTVVVTATTAQAATRKAGQPRPVQPGQQDSLWGSIISRFTGGSGSVTDAPSSSLHSTPSRMFPSLLPSRGATSSTRGPSAAAARKPAIVWFRGDLRLHDHEPLVHANRDGTSVLPVYCFDLREYGKNAQGFDRSGPYRARFILDALAEMRVRLREVGSELVVRVGRPEEVVPALAREVGAGAVYCHSEVAYEELQVERAVRAALQKEGVELRGYWGNTLFHPEDLPFSLQQLPSSYAEFKKSAGRAAVRPPLERPQRLKGLPAGGVEGGELPSMLDLGFSRETLEACERDRSVVAGLKGGEAEAFAQLQAFVSELTSRPASGATSGPSATTTTSAPARPSTSFSCRVSPWLAHGCLSPRELFDQVKRQFEEASAAAARASGGRGGGGAGGRSAEWLVYELMWRDFFKMITRKYSLALTAPGGKGKDAAGGAAEALAPQAAGMQPALAGV